MRMIARERCVGESTRLIVISIAFAPRWTPAVEKNKAVFYKWIPRVDERGADVTSRAREATEVKYEAIEDVATGKERG